MRKLLVLFAHPTIERSQANAELQHAAQSVEGVTYVDLYAEYPDFQIDIDREQGRLLQHDVIIFQHPLYWYSTPAILKEWQDLVLEHGFAYGHDGRALHGKLLLSALTAGGPEEAYRADGYNHFTLEELLRPLEQTASLCGMIWLPPLALFGARTAVEEDRLKAHVERWVNLLTALRDDTLDIAAARQAPLINTLVEVP